MTYEELLKNAPEHDSKRFIEYLREHNKVVFETPEWLVIENFKYHTPHHPWYTAFHKPKRLIGGIGVPAVNSDWYEDIDELWWHDEWHEWEWVKKSADKQTIKRFHLHIHRPPA